MSTPEEPAPAPRASGAGDRPIAPPPAPPPLQTPHRTPPAMPAEIGGPAGPEPTRYGDWEHKGRCSDF
ncbi:MAG: DUF1674 domain-containing protein [Rhodospirillales bacterium]|nr:DUF1674 domain-containing protein [Rhodospirillales bacterium]MDE2199039.1 DUF1674 domain-containing protein [Rhodospirillales bacterium]MDE2575914.1 DUF1674 domain-containing protein [Rhodospirillales bacterium]